MKKRITQVLLTLLILLVLTACGKKVESIETTVVSETTLPDLVPGLVYNPEGDDGNLGDDAVNEEADLSSKDELDAEDAEKVDSELAEETEYTKTTEPTETTESTKATDPTKATEPTKTTEPTKATEPSKDPEPTKPVDPVKPTEATITDYEWFEALSEDEQAAFVESFDSAIAFLEWYSNAEEEYKALHPDIVIDGSEINAEDIAGVVN